MPERERIGGGEELLGFRVGIRNMMRSIGKGLGFLVSEVYISLI